MPERHISVNIADVLALGDDFRGAAGVGVRRATLRGEQLVRFETPKVTHNLEQGVSSEVTVGANRLRGEVIVTARTGRVGRREATLHLPSGQTRQVTLRAVPPFNYAEAVAKGTGLLGPNRTAIRPKKAGVLLIPVTTVPTVNGKQEAFIVSDGKMYVMRSSAKGRRPNPYDQRAAARLESEVQPIFDRAIGEALEGNR